MSVGRSVSEEAGRAPVDAALPIDEGRRGMDLTAEAELGVFGGGDDAGPSLA